MPLQQTTGNVTTDAYGGGVAAVPQYIEDVFSTQVYTGTGATNNIVNGVDLATYGGLVWTKARTTTSAFTFAHALIDTLRGAGVQICSDRTDANYTQANSLTGFNTNGYTLGTDSGGQGRVNNTSYGTQTYVSWTFRKQPKFFDVVTYTGNGSTLTISHNLGSVPGCIIVKNTSSTMSWVVYHRSNGNDKVMYLNGTQAVSTDANVWNSYTPTATDFQVGGSSFSNSNGDTYVAYLFAHNAGGFGLTGTDNVISCGSYTGAGSPYTGGSEVTLGYEPQWLLIKRADTGTANWVLLDNMRGLTADGTNENWLYPNLSDAEGTSGTLCKITATGFKPYGSSLTNNTGTYIYIAIRRGPMKVPTSGTSVFSPVNQNGAGTITTNFPVDLAITRAKSTGDYSQAVDRLRGSSQYLYTASTFAEGSFGSPIYGYDNNIGYKDNFNSASYSIIYWNFQRAPSFFDEVCYTGTGSATTFTHNLTVVPEMMIVKSRSGNVNWAIYTASTGATKWMYFGTAGASTLSSIWNDTAPTSTVFTVGSASPVNDPAATYVAYLFATCAGVSKVGSYTGNGTTQTINCGFTGGARFVLIKRTDSTGDWYVYDTARGMTTLTDPYLLLNSTAAESATLGSVTTVSTGFAVNASILAAINTNAASYIFLAIS